MMNSTEQLSATIAGTLLSVGIEEGPDGSALVHSLGFPGCMAAGPSVERALEAFATELSAWLSFRESLGLAVPARDEELEIAVDEWVAADRSLADGNSDVCFEADLRPLEDGEISESLHLLGDLRGRLLRAVRAIPRKQLDLEAGDPVPLGRIFDELARAQWWTLTRLGASPMAEIPDSPLARLDTAMALVVQQFTGFAREARGRVLELDGEVWTPRKVLRRLLWLEWTLGGAALSLLPDGAQR